MDFFLLKNKFFIFERNNMVKFNLLDYRKNDKVGYWCHQELKAKEITKSKIDIIDILHENIRIIILFFACPVSLPAKMAMPDLPRYPWNLNLIKNVEDI